MAGQHRPAKPTNPEQAAMTKSYDNMNRVERITHTLTRVDFPVGAPAKEDGIIHRSGRSGVVAKVHAICDKLITEQGKSRKDVLAKCAKLGIAHGTAATQYDRWRNPPKAKKAK